MESSEHKIKIIKIISVINIIFLLFSVFLEPVGTLIGFLDIFRIPQIVATVITIVHFIFLKIYKAPRREWLFFTVTTILNVLGVFVAEILLAALMSV